MVPCGTPLGGCAGHMPPPSPNLRSPLWCSATRPSRSGIASPRQASAPPGHEPETASGSAPSPPPSVPLCGAFFGLAGPLHPGLVPLEAAVLVQRGPARVPDGLGLGHLLVVR